MKKQHLLLAFFCLLFLQTTFANPKVHHYQLSNGLNLFVKVDKRAPVVTSQVWYKIGSSYEPNGITGISHVLEHMMFQGTENYPQGEFSKIIAANGGQENAATSYDFTYYFENLANDKLPISFKLEADRMQNLQLNSKNFEKEIKVVQEERRLRTDNNPKALAYERFMAAAFVANPYHHPVIGWENDLKNMTLANVRDWYQAWYAPNNAIVVVVGDVNPEKVFQLAKKYFGAIPSHQLPILKPHSSVPQISERIVNLRLPAKVPFLIMGYNVPSINTTKKAWIPYALQLAAFALDGGKSARLPKNLIRKQEVASAIDSSYNPFSRLATVFTITAVPANGEKLIDLQKAIQQQVEKLKTDPVSKAELERIKTQLLAQKIYAEDSMSYQAQMIGVLESAGLSWKLGENFINNIDKITPAQIQAVAKTFFTPNRLTIAYLRPSKIHLPKQKNKTDKNAHKSKVGTQHEK